MIKSCKRTSARLFEHSFPRLEVRSMSQGSMHYGEPAYWEARYQEELRKSMIKMESFDWYMLFEPSELENGFLTDLY
jgi:hypothetical protein